MKKFFGVAGKYNMGQCRECGTNRGNETVRGSSLWVNSHFSRGTCDKCIAGGIWSHFDTPWPTSAGGLRTADFRAPYLNDFRTSSMDTFQAAQQLSQHMSKSLRGDDLRTVSMTAKQDMREGDVVLHTGRLATTERT